MVSLNIRHLRAIKIIEKNLKLQNLNLSGLTILTEVGSNNYLYTPIIAALANAKHVYAWTRDTVYGKGEVIKKECLEIAKALGISGKLTVEVNSTSADHIRTADIITNSGFLRPINAKFLEAVNEKCVIPLMYEAWEVRASDIEIEACKQKNIRVAGTWENHPSIRVFDSVGQLSVKLAHDAGFEVVQNNIIIWSDDHFGEIAHRAFIDAGASSVISTVDVDEFYDNVGQADFVYICDYDETRPIFGSKGLISIEKIKKLNNALGVVHLYGDIDVEFLKSNDIFVHPQKRGRPSVMTESLAYLGPQPAIALQVAGFKVAESMCKNEANELVQRLTY